MCVPGSLPVQYEASYASDNPFDSLNREMAMSCCECTVHDGVTCLSLADSGPSGASGVKSF